MLAFVILVVSEVAATTATLAAGFVAPFLVQFIKVRLKWEGGKAFALTAVMSGLLALGVLFFTGEITNVKAVTTQLPAVFGVATLIYKTWSFTGK